MKATKAQQERFDAMLEKAIRDIRALGYESIGTIEPHVRITGNVSRIGSCKELTGAYLRSSGHPRLRANASPAFRISCSVNAGSDDAEIMDTMYHEVIHTLPGCFSHGDGFQSAAAKVNRAYHARVSTTKVHEVSARSAEMDAYIGRRFKVAERMYRLDDVLHNRPKWSCAVTEEGTGKQYLMRPDTVLAGLV